MKNKMKNRTSEEIIYQNEDKFTCFLYEKTFGRILLKPLYLPFISKLGGLYMSSPLSKLKIKKFIKTNSINMDDYQEEKYHNFNEFFTRIIKKDSRIINMDKNILISPCDSKLSVYKIEDNKEFTIKHTKYHLEDLINQNDINNYQNGYILVFRLCVDDYHRYCYVDDGNQKENIKIKGVLHTVRPIALSHTKVFSENSREYTILKTKNFGDIIQIEVGALMVGKIINLHDNYTFQKGEEKGYFKFGGSTIIMIVKDINIDEDILTNSQNDIETIVKYGERIGIKQTKMSK